VITLTITMDEKGQVLVTGPLQDKLVCLGLLDMAHAVVLAHVPEKSKIIKPTLSHIQRGN
jgi:hypothetical protein